VGYSDLCDLAPLRESPVLRGNRWGLVELVPPTFLRNEAMRSARWFKVSSSRFKVYETNPFRKGKGQDERDVQDAGAENYQTNPTFMDFRFEDLRFQIGWDGGHRPPLQVEHAHSSLRCLCFLLFKIPHLGVFASLRERFLRNEPIL
jgi:hypothetical protein